MLLNRYKLYITKEVMKKYLASEGPWPVLQQGQLTSPKHLNMQNAFKDLVPCLLRVIR